MIKQYFWFIPFCASVVGYLAIAFIYRPHQVPIPHLVGYSIHDAVRSASDHQLNIRIINEKEDANLPDGTIINQIPKSPGLTKSSQTIYCTASKRPEKMMVPSFLKQSKAMILKELNALGMRSKIEYLPSDLPKDHCFAQYPSPGSFLEDEPIIIYLARSAQEPIVWPNLKGQSVSEVQNFLQLNGIEVNSSHTTLQEPYHICTQHCVVVDQRPLAGTILPESSLSTIHVQLYVHNPYA